MPKTGKIDFQRCLSGIEFEGWVVDPLKQLTFPAGRVGKNDCGVDIVAKATWEGKTHLFYIQHQKLSLHGSTEKGTNVL